jgi:hypothetical protein
MKLITKTRDERVRGAKASGRTEQRFRYPATREISEISCGPNAERWSDRVEPADADRPDIAVAS